MSVKITVPSPTGGNYVVEVPLGSVAATDTKTSYAETQSMIASFTAKTVQSLLGPDATPDVANVEVRDRRLLASCYVERAGARTTNAGLGDPEALVVAVVQASGRTGGGRGRAYRYIVRNYTPLRRVLNAYAGQRKKDVQALKLMWRGRRVGYEDTAEKLGIADGDVLQAEAVSRRHRVLTNSTTTTESESWELKEEEEEEEECNPIG